MCLSEEPLLLFPLHHTTDVAMPLQAAKICKAKGAPEVETYSCDLLDSASLNETVKKFLSSHKHCDVLVNCAGMMGSGSPTEGQPCLLCPPAPVLCWKQEQSSCAHLA